MINTPFRNVPSLKSVLNYIQIYPYSDFKNNFQIFFANWHNDPNFPKVIINLINQADWKLYN